MFEAVSQLADEHAELEGKLADPSVHSDQSLARKLGQRYAELSSVLRAHEEWLQLGENLEAARELAQDPELGEAFAIEAEELALARATAEERLRALLIPRDPLTARTSCWRSSPARAARSRHCSPVTCSACTPGTPNAVAGRPRCSMPTSPTSGATSR